MSENLQALRGMKDILPSESASWLALEEIIMRLLTGYGYEQVRLPLIEHSNVFHRAIGALTDIVAKEMYTWNDYNGDSLSLRPEGTAGCARLVNQHHLLRRGTQKLWYMGAMFRHERPQKGRYRQFHQFGVEVFGLADAKIDAEIIEMGYKLWQILGLSDVHLEINSLGSLKDRSAYTSVLTDYFRAYISALDEDSMRRLEKNPLRILDSKNKKLRSLIQNAPKIFTYLDAQSRAHFEKLKYYLDSLNINYIVNPHLVRGLDYYNSTVFEWVSNDLGAQNAICAGGRYDGLLTQMGGQSSPAIGFAVGLERLLLLSNLSLKDTPRIYLVTEGEPAQLQSFKLAGKLKQAIHGLVVYNNMTTSSRMKTQFKKADKLGCDFAIILAQEEMAKGEISIKPLKSTDKQMLKSEDELINFLKSYYL